MLDILSEKRNILCSSLKRSTKYSGPPVLKECLWLRPQENREPGVNPGRLRRCNGRRRPQKCHCPERVGKARPEDDSEVRRPALSPLSQYLCAGPLKCADKTVSPKAGWDARRPSVPAIVAPRAKTGSEAWPSSFFVGPRVEKRTCVLRLLSEHVVGAAWKNK
jgi:hypothetical protein